MPLERLDEKGFVFLDARNRPYRCCMWDGTPWLFYWHKHENHWVSLRPVTQFEVWGFPKNLSLEQQDYYNNRHAEWLEKTSIVPGGK